MLTSNSLVKHGLDSKLDPADPYQDRTLLLFMSLCLGTGPVSVIKFVL